MLMGANVLENSELDLQYILLPRTTNDIIIENDDHGFLAYYTVHTLSDIHFESTFIATILQKSTKIWCALKIY